MSSPAKQRAERLLSALIPPHHPGREEQLAAARRLDAEHADGASAVLNAWSSFVRGRALPSTSPLRELVAGLADLLGSPVELRLRPREVLELVQETRP